MTARIRTHQHGPVRYFTCTCGQRQAINAVMPWCCKCVVEYDINRVSVTLRPDRKTERFAFAKALNASGGMQLGNVTKGSP